MLHCCILNQIIVHIKEFLGRSSKKLLLKQSDEPDFWRNEDLI
jgi:hypothetical protein